MARDRTLVVELMGYYSRLLRLALHDPLKLPGLWRLRTGGEHRSGRFYRRDDGTSAFPITVCVRPTYRCNLRCVQCGQWGEHGALREPPRAEDELSTDEIQRFIAEVAPFRPFVHFTGGEPLMRPDLFQLIRHAADRHLLTGLSSNCTLLGPHAEELVRSGLDYLYASLDAPSSANDQIRRGPDSFARAVEGVRQVLAVRDQIGIGLPLLQVQTIILRENQDRLCEMGEFVERELGADVWGLQLRVFTTPERLAAAEQVYRDRLGVSPDCWRGFLMESMEGLDFDLLERQLERIRRRRWRLRLRLYKPLGLPGFSFRKYFLQPGELFVSPPCRYPFAFVQLQPNGDLAFCGSQPDFVFGNARERPFAELWNGERARSFRRVVKQGLFPVCSRCFGLHVFSHY